jgi:hypothetical protein
MYFDGTGVEKDYAEAARWFLCPTPSTKILESCRETSYKDLPQGAVALLKTMKCNVDAGSNYDYGSVVDLSRSGLPEYQVCCGESPHGPCGSVVIGKIGTAWRDLTAKQGLLGFTGACNGFVPLETQYNGFHDVCLPSECSTLEPDNRRCGTANLSSLPCSRDSMYCSLGTSFLRNRHRGRGEPSQPSA